MERAGIFPLLLGKFLPACVTNAGRPSLHAPGAGAFPFLSVGLADGGTSPLPPPYLP